MILDPATGQGGRSMEVDLKNIIEKIKEEGVGVAEKKAADIKSQAEAKASEIIKAAESQRDEIIKNAKAEAEKLRNNGEESLRQASRDVLLSLRKSIVNLFDSVVKQDIQGQFKPDVLKDIITRVVENAAKEKVFEVEILLNEKDKTNLENVLFDDLKKEFKKGVTLKVSPNVEYGFRIGEKDGSSYYDFTDEAILEAFKAYLNPKMVQILSAGTPVKTL